MMDYGLSAWRTRVGKGEEERMIYLIPMAYHWWYKEDGSRVGYLKKVHETTSIRYMILKAWKAWFSKLVLEIIDVDSEFQILAWSFSPYHFSCVFHLLRKKSHIIKQDRVLHVCWSHRGVSVQNILLICEQAHKTLLNKSSNGGVYNL